jgi:hypothetical protein
MISVPIVQRKDSVPHPMVLFSSLPDVHACIELRARAYPVSVRAHSLTGERERMQDEGGWYKSLFPHHVPSSCHPARTDKHV